MLQGVTHGEGGYEDVAGGDTNGAGDDGSDAVENLAAESTEECVHVPRVLIYDVYSAAPRRMMSSRRRPGCRETTGQFFPGPAARARHAQPQAARCSAVHAAM